VQEPQAGVRGKSNDLVFVGVAYQKDNAAFGPGVCGKQRSEGNK
jgi:hypothetical protein